jgi:vancomycin permeability regulator SanA
MASWESGRFEPSKAVREIVARGLALFLGGFGLLNVLGGIRAARFDANLWWIDLRAVPKPIATTLLLVSSACLIAFALAPPRSAWRRMLSIVCVSVLALVAALNAVGFYWLLARGQLAAGIPLPLSLLIMMALGVILLAILRPPATPRSRSESFWVAMTAFTCLVGFTVAQMFCFGKTDYRRPADAAVVLGARVYADGRPSDALADRVRTACELYRNGLVGKLIFSGGPGDGPIHETEAMQRMAVQLGVHPDDIWLDKQGLNTLATVKNTEAALTRWHAERLLVVSHAYHLPRIKLTYQREGRDVFTVPARESYLLRQLPYNMAREVAAFWVYYLRPLLG